MGLYTPIIYKGNYIDRQKQANIDKCVCYIEQHINAAASQAANGAFCVVKQQPGPISVKWATSYVQGLTLAYPSLIKFGGPNSQGYWPGGYMGRGAGSLKYAQMPAILCEPIYITNPKHQAMLKNEADLKALAKVLVDSIVENFPKGGKVGLSIGHLYKTSNPYDKGAYEPAVGYEGTYCEKIINYAKELLEHA